jgi:cytochrome c oxidase subunit III
MQIGSADTVIDAEKPRRRRPRIAGTGSSGPGSGGDGYDGNGADGPFPTSDDADAVSIDKSRYIAWFLLLAIAMTFAGLLGAYVMLATNKAAEWKPFELPFQVWISTGIILLSSITYSLGKRAVDNEKPLYARNWLLATTGLGGAFVSSQLVLWIQLVNRGYYMSGNPYAGFFYILTAAHLVHVAGGMIALGSILLKIWYPAASGAEMQRRRDLARSVGWYWHFMGFLWVVLFAALGFWK